MDLRDVFWNQNRVTGRLKLSMKSGSEGDMVCEFLNCEYAKRVWYGLIGDWRLKMYMKCFHFLFHLVRLALFDEVRDGFVV